MALPRVCVSGLVLSFALAVSVAACNSEGGTAPRDEEDPNSPPSILLVSAPSTVSAASSAHANAADVSYDGDTYTWLSAAPRSVPGVAASITNRTRARQSGSDSRMQVALTDGGLDPVPVPASVGDTLHIEFLAADGSVLVVAAAVVPKVRPPTIVRTNPRPGKKDVPLNARFEIVFSEPIDPGTIRPGNIQVVTGGAAVRGSLVQTNDFTVEFVPEEPLRPETSYRIVIGTGVRNLGGIALESEFSVNFETGATTNSSPTCSAETQCLAFVRDGGIFTTAFVSTGSTYGTLGGGVGSAQLLHGSAAAPIWSPDGRQLVFQTSSRTDLCVADPEGQGVRCLKVFVDHPPSWSPDGSELAFVGSLQPDSPFQPRPRQLFALKAANMTLRVILPDVGTFCGTSVSWSPDGARIAFTSLPSMCGALATVRPDGSDLQVVASLNAAQPIRSIAWSPDGLSFAVLVNMREEDCPGGCDAAMGTMKADGTAWQPLVTASWGGAGEMIESPTWSPDGSAILYGAGWNCFMGCSDYGIQFVKRDGSARGTVLAKAAEPSVRPVVR